MDSSYLAQQVNTIIGQLHNLFDEIGVPNHERESREAELFAALSETLNNQVRLVSNEKKSMIEEAQRLATVVGQMEASIDDGRRDYHSEDALEITYPLTRCLQSLKEKHAVVSRLHKERFEQVKKLVQALESYSSHLEPTFVRIALPPTDPNQAVPTNFDLSPSYVDKLDAEFTRVYEEYNKRIDAVQTTADQIIQLWAELGTPQAQTEPLIVKYYRDAPEQLGLHEEDLSRLRARRDKLSDEKKSREKRLRDLRVAVDALWEKLGVDEAEQKAFLNANRGCGVRQINEFEAELCRLNELKRENLHLFVEDARFKLQELWDALYFSEDEMLEFTPAFSDVYSDALLEAHEREIARLETLREQRAPTLALIDKHRSLIKERSDLSASSQDASRLMTRGQKGEKRDPGKLLREEKMRKRIAKELPKVTLDLRRILESWEDEYGRPFLVHGDRYLDVLDAESNSNAKAPGPRAKTPAGVPLAGAPKSASKMPAPRPQSAVRPTVPPPSRTMTKTPTAAAPAAATQQQQSTTARRPPVATQSTVANPKGSPSRIPARVPLSNMKHGSNSPERQRQPLARPESSLLHYQPQQQQQQQQQQQRAANPVMRAPPPKMRDLKNVPDLDTPVNPYSGIGLGSSIVRHVEPEDVYDDRPKEVRQMRSQPNLTRQYSDESYASYRPPHSTSYPQAPPPRQISNSSNASTNISGSENWETYDDTSEPELDASDTYYAKVRAARGKRMEPEYGHRPHSSQAKRYRGLPSGANPHSSVMIVDQEGNRIISGSEWTDEDVF